MNPCRPYSTFYPPSPSLSTSKIWCHSLTWWCSSVQIQTLWEERKKTTCVTLEDWETCSPGRWFRWCASSRCVVVWLCASVLTLCPDRQRDSQGDQRASWSRRAVFLGFILSSSFNKSAVVPAESYFKTLRLHIHYWKDGLSQGSGPRCAALLIPPSLSIIIIFILVLFLLSANL